MSTSLKSEKKLALVLSGGGARGAYEAGVVHYIRTMLPANVRFQNFHILCGNSVGALNAAFIAALADNPDLQGREICSTWESMREEKVYRRDFQALINFCYKNLSRVAWNLLSKKSYYFGGLLDTSPFLSSLKKMIRWKGISKNIQQHHVDALSIVATNVITGLPELFIEKNDQLNYQGNAKVHFTPILPVHVMASSNIPIMFPVVNFSGTPYTDGGLSLNTPLSPAIQLGADKILVIGLHGRRSSEEFQAISQQNQGEVTLSMVLGRVMDSLFVNRVESDLEQLERINRLIEMGEKLYDEKFLNQVNQGLRDMRHPEFFHGFKKLEVLSLQPSENLGKIFSYCYQRRRDLYFSSFEKILFRILDIDPTSGNELLSYISFMPDYLKTLLYLGFEDAKKQHNALKEFLEL